MATHALRHHEPFSPELRRGITARLAQLGLQYGITAAIMFLCAGSVAWWQGWLWLALSLAGVAAIGVWVLPRNPEVIAERARLYKDTAAFDKVLLPLLTVFGGALYVVAALDSGRFHWAPLSWPWSAAGAVLVLLALVPVAGAMGVNRRLATTVRVEKEAEHRLATEGPYRVVRHPMYASALVQYPALALLLGSAWALVPAVATVVVVIVRTALEDRTLHRELKGYTAYARRTRWRLVPGVW